MASQIFDDVGGSGHVPVLTKDIINNLIESYKQKKISGQDLLRDPIFLSLPINKQVEIVQAYSSSLAGMSIAPNTSKILTKAIRTGATTGLIAALPTTFLMKNITGRIAMSAIGAGGGALVGLVGGIMSARSEKNRYETTNKYLIQLSKNKEILTAFKVLDVNRKYEPRTLASIISRMESPEKAVIEKAVGIIAPKTRDRMLLENPEIYK